MKFMSALGYTIVRFVGIFLLFWLICAGLFILFSLCGFIDYYWGFFPEPSHYEKGENLAKALPLLSIAVNFSLTHFIYYKTGYKNITVKKQRFMLALRKNLWLWRNFYCIVLAIYMFTCLFDDWAYWEIKENPAFYLFNLALFIIFCVFGRFNESRVKTEKQVVIEHFFVVMGVVLFIVIFFRFLIIL